IQHVGRLSRAGGGAVRPAAVRWTVSHVLRERGASLDSGGRGRMSVRPVAIVTGGTRGIGLGIARSLASDGWDLALCGLRQEDAVRPALDDLRSAGAGVLYRSLDVRHIADHDVFVAAVHDRWARIDALVNNAGRAPRARADLLDATEASFDDVLRANLYGPYFLTQRVARPLVQQRADTGGRPPSIVSGTAVPPARATTRRRDA